MDECNKTETDSQIQGGNKLVVTSGKKGKERSKIGVRG